MTALTPDDLARIEELAEKATPGPWQHQPYGGQNQNGDYFGGWIYDEQSGEYVVSEITDQDGAFIAAARTAVPALVAGVRSLHARITELEGERAQIRSILALSGTDVNSTNKILDVLDGAR